MSDLKTIQRLLWSLITAPDGVAAALERADADGGTHRAELEAVVCGDDRLTAAERLDVYANMYFYRLLDVLRDDYPAVVALVGDASFHNLVTDYLLQHYPTRPSLRWAGRHLADYLRSHPLTQAHPCLVDLARFEWTMTLAFDAADAPVATAEHLQSIAADAWPDLRLTTHPSVHLLESGWNVRDVRLAVQSQKQPQQPVAAHTFTVLWRQNLRVFHRNVSAVEWAGFNSLREEVPFATLCEKIAACSNDADDPVATTAAYLTRWVADGIVRGF